MTVCLDDALDPNTTDWTTTPPTVNTVKRDTYGWSRGAYAYRDGGSGGGPQVALPAIPTNLRIIN